jgi:aryl-alcohol dehydrogenase-like predicted oxidoreductase
MPEGIAVPNQQLEGSDEPVPIVLAAHKMGVMVMAGSTLHRGRFAAKLPSPVEAHPALIDGQVVSVRHALQFTRSVPGLTSALVGMSNPRHVEENLAIANVPPLSEPQFAELLAQSGAACRV